MSKKTLHAIINLLEEKDVSYKHLHHEEIPKESAAASKIRGTAHEQGAKALILKSKEGLWCQVVVLAHQRISLKKVRKYLEVKNISLAHPDEVQEKTDCVVGSVPPLGVLWDIPVLIDKGVLDRETIVFSAGTLTDSIFISSKDFIRVSNGILLDVKKE